MNLYLYFYEYKKEKPIITIIKKSKIDTKYEAKCGLKNNISVNFYTKSKKFKSFTEDTRKRSLYYLSCWYVCWCM